MIAIVGSLLYGKGKISSWRRRLMIWRKAYLYSKWRRRKLCFRMRTKSAFFVFQTETAAPKRYKILFCSCLIGVKEYLNRRPSVLPGTVRSYYRFIFCVRHIAVRIVLPQKGKQPENLRSKEKMKKS